MNRASLLAGIAGLLLSVPAAAVLNIAAPEAPAGLRASLAAHARLAGLACDAPGWRVRRLFDALDADLDPALRAFGYYQPQLSKALNPGRDDAEREDADAGDGVDDAGCWQASVNVLPGPRVRVVARRIEIRGEMATDPAWQTLAEQLPLPVGAPLNHADYETIKARLRELAQSRGYVAFRLTESRLRVDPAQQSADIVVVADSGPRYRFGALRVSETALDSDLIGRYFALSSGEPYDAAALLATDRALSDSGYFSRVELRARRDQAADGDIPVDIGLDMVPRHAWRAGAGYASDIGPRFQLGYHNRYINRRGHRFDAAIEASPVRRGLDLNYTVPGRNPLADSFVIGAQVVEENDDTVDSRRMALSGRRVTTFGPWTRTVGLELSRSEEQRADGSETLTLLMPGWRMTRVEADDLMRTRRGHRLDFEARAAHQGLLSSVSFLQLRAAAKLIHRFGDAGRMTVRGEAGVSWVADALDLPASVRFFAGGDNSVRGYDFRSLGPRDADDEPRGGKHLITASVEYEHPVSGEDWWAAAFVDTGNVFDQRPDALHTGYGVGLRWYSPVGRVRVDLAMPQDGDGGLHFYLGLGVDL